MSGQPGCTIRSSPDWSRVEGAALRRQDLYLRVDEQDSLGLLASGGEQLLCRPFTREAPTK